MNLTMQKNYAVFEDEVVRNFNFLEQQYGFHISQIKQIGFEKLIRFESPLVYVNLFYGPPAYEAEMSFGRIGIDDAPGAYSFDQGDLILLSSSAGWKWDAVNSANLVLIVRIAGLAQVLRECGAVCLTGDKAVFEEMKERRDNAVKCWRQEEKAADIRKEVDAAWGRKDYDAVVNMYEQMGDALTEIENKKLEYAKRQK